MNAGLLHPPLSENSTHATAAQRFRIGGRVQGVGFRPFVYRLACLFDIAGWVRNSGGEVEIHAQGRTDQLAAFAEALLTRAPPASRARLLDVRTVSGESDGGFVILASLAGTEQQIRVPVDLFTCNDCLAELRDPAARRYRYPFINCTQCGPRYTLIRAMPYDRPNTTLESFAMCRECAEEYSNPVDRRFHAQPLACAACGPILSWHDGSAPITGNERSLAAALAALHAGAIIALRGVGGYHLSCDARSEAAVARLRARKGRPSKPLAIMVPWRGLDGLDYARGLAEISPLEAAALLDTARPIVLVPKRAGALIAASVAPGLGEFAVMLPYSPLHYLLIEEFGSALVATSGNISGEPVLTEPGEAQERLAAVADGFLHHDRPIARPADDPVVRVVASVARPLRLGRGTAPLELGLPQLALVPTLAVGAYMKTTVALAWADRVVVSPHIGDLSSPRGRTVFAQVAHDLQRLYGVTAKRIVHDAHPDFPNTRWALESGLPTQRVWHHHAHAAAVAGEYPSDAPLLCFTWDGVGLGADKTLWGGEGLLGRPGDWQRVTSFRPFRLLGADRAAREPWRSALSLCWGTGQTWREGEAIGGPLLRMAFDAGVSVADTTSVGRLFDAAAALLGVCLRAAYEGEAPMLAEALCTGEAVAPVALPLVRDKHGIWRSDWAPLLAVMLDKRLEPSNRSAIFHSSLAQALVDQALAIREQNRVERVGLSGGVFQNRILTEQARAKLTAAGFEVLIPRQLPVNDAAISFGQLIEATAIHAAHA